MSRAPLTEDARRFLRHFGETLRDLRRETHLLQEQLAARAGTVGARVGEIERGNVDTSLSRAWTLARVLGLSLSAVFQRVELASMDGRARDEIRARVIAEVRRLAPADLDLVASVVRRLARGSGDERKGA